MHVIAICHQGNSIGYSHFDENEVAIVDFFLFIRVLLSDTLSLIFSKSINFSNAENSDQIKHILAGPASNFIWRENPPQQRPVIASKGCTAYHAPEHTGATSCSRAKDTT